MFSCQILDSVLPFESLHVEIHDAVVEVLATQANATRGRPHLEYAILDRQDGDGLWLPGTVSRCIGRHNHRCVVYLDRRLVSGILGNVSSQALAVREGDKA